MPFASKSLKFFSMVITKYNTIQDLIDKLQQLKGKINYKFYQKKVIIMMG